LRTEDVKILLILILFYGTTQVTVIFNIGKLWPLRSDNYLAREA